jgi:hypothetical protein
MARYTRVDQFEEIESGSKTYSYLPSPWQAFGLAGFVAVLAGLCGWTAATNKRGLIFNQIIPLGPTEASVFLWLCTILLLWGALGFVCAYLLRPKAIQLTATSITFLPSILGSNSICIEFASIRQLQCYKYRDHSTYTIYYADDQREQKSVQLSTWGLQAGALPIILSAIESRSPSLQAEGPQG